MSNKETDLVRYSRAGDAFHYRWAARRCLKMVNPLSKLSKVIIEGSSNPKFSGECVIDVSEYYVEDLKDTEYIKYFQLKHTTVQKDNPFTLSDLKQTIIGFSERYKEHIYKDADHSNIEFYLVSNRPISDNFKTNIDKIIENKQCDKRFLRTINKYTNLEDKALSDFLKCFNFIVGEGDYYEQMRTLHLEIRNLVVGTAEHPQIDSITSLISDKALPHSDGAILPEDILKRLGCSSLCDLFPAQPEYETDHYIVPMAQHEELVKNIITSDNPVVIHAAGGVGKSIFAREIQCYLNNDSIAIVYDCFGAGKYRNRSSQRHRYRDALVQINNELSLKGLCDPIIAPSNSLEDEILKLFLDRIKIALLNLKKINQYAKIVVVIDAADNAEMAALEFGDPCFVHELLRENLPQDCHLVMLCRTERKYMLKPGSNIQTYELAPFSINETLNLLRQTYKTVTKFEAEEFHRLTNGNPRVQTNTISGEYENILEALNSLGLGGTTVDKLIEEQLENAVAQIQEKLSPDFQDQINAICTGLATLPPYIPIHVLAKIARVEETTIESFVSDFGRPIWTTKSVIQFRDEPTETWFRNVYAGTKQQIIEYISLLKPIANQYSYVAEVLPSLFLQAEQYDELIALALSDEFVPNENPIDKRNIIVYRLQFAFKAALKLKRYDDATKIAVLAGEEMAGNKRQLEIFKKNIDLIAPLQDSQKIQELAFKRMISGAWKGSENIFSASLLSNVTEFHGEAHSYLRSSLNWLKLYFEERNKKGEKFSYEKLENEDITEITFAIYNLRGEEDAIDFILNWKPPEVIYNVASIFSKKMIDLNRVDDLNNIAKLGAENLYFIIAVSHELLDIGFIVPKNFLTKGLELLSKGEVKLPDITDFYRKDMLKAVISFLELCAMYRMNKEKIIEGLDNYFVKRAPVTFNSNYRNDVREIYLRSVALRIFLLKNNDYDIEELLPEKFLDSNTSYRDENVIKEYKEMINGLLPWFLARLQVLFNNGEALQSIVNKTDEKTKQIHQSRHKRFDVLPRDILNVCVDILLICGNNEKDMISNYFDKYILNNSNIWMDTQIRALRGANRLEHLSDLRHKLESSVFNNIEKQGGDTETRAEYYIGLSRATLAISKADAAEYFNMAITVVSRFGDEIVERWRAITEIAEQSCSDKLDLPELSYRFIRCGELVGESIDEKYFDRNKTMKICTKLSPKTGLSSLSRWRDRGVGWFEELLPVVVIELLKTKYISPLVAWSFVMLMEEHSIHGFIETCLKEEVDPFNREKLTNQGIDLLRLFNIHPSVWKELKKLADNLDIENDKLDDIYSKTNNCNQESNYSESDSMKYKYNNITDSELLEVFDGLNIFCIKDIKKSYVRFKKCKDSYYNKQTFWERFFEHVPSGDIVKFLFIFIEVDIFDLYLIGEAFQYIPDYWLKKPSFKRAWPKIIENIAKKSAYYLLNSYSRESFVKNLKINKEEQVYVKEGVIKGLIDMQGLETADVYFGFVNSVASMLDAEQARDVLDFALSRFEIHIEDNFGDGNWSFSHEIQSNSSETIAGFIWSALGSPLSEVRWKAVHCIKVLGYNDCQPEIEALIDWMSKKSIQSFGYYGFPFYYLHAKLYLLIAIARLSRENSKLILKYASTFSKIALDSTSHILMQLHAKRIALNIEKTFPQTYENDTIEKLNYVGTSPYERGKVEDGRKSIPSIWHEEGKVNTDIHFYHGYDFERYWFEPLGRIFGISAKQIEELATEVIIDEWKIIYDGSYSADPRNILWSSYKYENKIYDSHGTYPAAETYSFYLSFHAMFVVASRLINNMPVLCNKQYEYEGTWEEWLQRFMPAQNNELFLSDRRDEAPLLLPEWTNNKDDTSWINEIDDQYFIDTLVKECEPEVWLNVYSSWTNGKQNRIEEIYISSALVEVETSKALLNALYSCKNSHDYKIPYFEEEGMEFDKSPFELKGWIKHENSADGLDRLDKLSGGINYPVYKVGDLFIKK